MWLVCSVPGHLHLPGPALSGPERLALVLGPYSNLKWETGPERSRGVRRQGRSPGVGFASELSGWGLGCFLVPSCIPGAMAGVGDPAYQIQWHLLLVF